MKRRHVTGRKVEKPHSQDWYRSIEAAHIARIEAAWHAQPTQPQPAPQPAEEHTA